MDNSLTPIGANEYITLANRYQNVPAKIDTGADSSTVWCSHSCITADGDLEFILFGEKSPFYDGHIFHVAKGSYEIVVGKSSTGHRYCRYCVPMTIKVANRTIRASVTLADRSRHSMPVLIGRKTLAGKFFVDVKLGPKLRHTRPITTELNQELASDPYRFHQKYSPSSSTKATKTTNAARTASTTKTANTTRAINTATTRTVNTNTTKTTNKHSAKKQPQKPNPKF